MAGNVLCVIVVVTVGVLPALWHVVCPLSDGPVVGQCASLQTVDSSSGRQQQAVTEATMRRAYESLGLNPVGGGKMIAAGSMIPILPPGSASAVAAAGKRQYLSDCCFRVLWHQAVVLVPMSVLGLSVCVVHQ